MTEGKRNPWDITGIPVLPHRFNRPPVVADESTPDAEIAAALKDWLYRPFDISKARVKTRAEYRALRALRRREEDAGFGISPVSVTR